MPRALVVALLLARADVAVAQLTAATAPTPPDTTVHRHLGFFARPHVGVGYLSSSQPSAAFGEQSATGGAFLGGVTIGGAVAENVILAGKLWYAVISSSSLSVGAQRPVTPLGTFGSGSNDTLGVGGIGPSLTYYFMPENVYVTVTPTLTRLVTRVIDEVRGSRGGFAAHASVGKEWWVSDHWGLGLAVEGLTSWNPSGTPGFGTITTWAAGVAFSATYN